MLYKKATYRVAMHILKLSMQQNSIKDFMVQNSVIYKLTCGLN